ncbi:MAG: hypothetical protein HY582_04230, partial [Candidatus Omnitrophica bacterium]|nr:hypothetical protein [Candidatus Omnitrophota bacterium]
NNGSQKSSSGRFGYVEHLLVDHKTPPRILSDAMHRAEEIAARQGKRVGFVIQGSLAKNPDFSSFILFFHTLMRKGIPIVIGSRETYEKVKGSGVILKPRTLHYEKARTKLSWLMKEGVPFEDLERRLLQDDVGEIAPLEKNGKAPSVLVWSEDILRNNRNNYEEGREALIAFPGMEPKMVRDAVQRLIEHKEEFQRVYPARKPDLELEIRAFGEGNIPTARQNIHEILSAFISRVFPEIRSLTETLKQLNPSASLLELETTLDSVLSEKMDDSERRTIVKGYMIDQPQVIRAMIIEEAFQGRSFENDQARVIAIRAFAANLLTTFERDTNIREANDLPSLAHALDRAIRKLTLEEKSKFFGKFPKPLARRLIKDALMHAHPILRRIGEAIDQGIRVRVVSLAPEIKTNLALYEPGNWLYVLGADSDHLKGWRHALVHPVSDFETRWEALISKAYEESHRRLHANPQAAARKVAHFFTDDWFSSLNQTIVDDFVPSEDVDFSKFPGYSPPDQMLFARLDRVEDRLRKTHQLLDELIKSGPAEIVLIFLQQILKRVEYVQGVLGKKDQREAFYSWMWDARRRVYRIEKDLNKTYGQAELIAQRLRAVSESIDHMLEDPLFRVVKALYQSDFQKLTGERDLIPRTRIRHLTAMLEQTVNLIHRLLQNDVTPSHVYDPRNPHLFQTKQSLDSRAKEIYGYLRDIRKKWFHHYLESARETLQALQKLTNDPGRTSRLDSISDAAMIEQLESLQKKAKHQLMDAKEQLDSVFYYVEQIGEIPYFQTEYRDWAFEAARSLRFAQYVHGESYEEVESELNEMNDALERSLAEGGNLPLGTQLDRTNYFLSFGQIEYAIKLLHQLIQASGALELFMGGNAKMEGVSLKDMREFPQVVLETKKAIARLLVLHGLTENSDLRDLLNYAILEAKVEDIQDVFQAVDQDPDATRKTEEIYQSVLNLEKRLSRVGDQIMENRGELEEALRRGETPEEDSDREIELEILKARTRAIQTPLEELPFQAHAINEYLGRSIRNNLLADFPNDLWPGDDLGASRKTVVDRGIVIMMILLGADAYKLWHHHLGAYAGGEGFEKLVRFVIRNRFFYKRNEGKSAQAESVLEKTIPMTSVEVLDAFAKSRLARKYEKGDRLLFLNFLAQLGIIEQKDLEKFLEEAPLEIKEEPKTEQPPILDQVLQRPAVHGEIIPLPEDVVDEILLVSNKDEYRLYERVKLIVKARGISTIQKFTEAASIKLHETYQTLRNTLRIQNTGSRLRDAAMTRRRIELVKAIALILHVPEELILGLSKSQLPEGTIAPPQFEEIPFRFLGGENPATPRVPKSVSSRGERPVQSTDSINPVVGTITRPAEKVAPVIKLDPALVELSKTRLEELNGDREIRTQLTGLRSLPSAVRKQLLIAWTSKERKSFLSDDLELVIAGELLGVR